MPATKTVQLKSCSRGHVYLGQECPCEQVYGTRNGQSSRPASSQSSRLDAEFSPAPRTAPTTQEAIS